MSTRYFAPMTPEHELGLTPCADKLWRYLLWSKKAGTPQEIWLNEIPLEHNGKDYSLRQRRRALSQLVEEGVVEILKTYSKGRVFKVIAWHPGKTTWEEFKAKDKKVPLETEKSTSGLKSPKNTPQTPEASCCSIENNSDKTEKTRSEEPSSVVSSQNIHSPELPSPTATTGVTARTTSPVTDSFPGYVNSSSNSAMQMAADPVGEQFDRSADNGRVRLLADIENQLLRFKIVNPSLLDALSRAKIWDLQKLYECLELRKLEDKEQVQLAISATAQAIAEKRVNSLARFLKAAVTQRYTPNVSHTSHKDKDEWWRLVLKQGFLRYGQGVEGEHQVACDADHWGKRSKLEPLLPLNLLQSLKPNEEFEMRELFKALLWNDLAAVESNVFVQSGRVKFIQEDWINS